MNRENFIIGFVAIAMFGLVVIAVTTYECDQACTERKIDRLVSDQEKYCMQEVDGFTEVNQACMEAYENDIATLSTQSH